MAEPDRDLAASDAGRRADLMGCFEDALRSDLSLDRSASTIAASLGIPDRTMRALCASHLGMPPLRYQQLWRMQLARRALRDATPGAASVAEIARSCGFEHAGRFAATYRARFAEYPSGTLRRRPGG
jgi:transcriptional regulator GlxA family with amidase domain